MSQSLTHCDCGATYEVMNSRKVTIGGLQTVFRQRRCKPCSVRKRSIELPEAIALKLLALNNGAPLK